MLWTSSFVMTYTRQLVTGVVKQVAILVPHPSTHNQHLKTVCWKQSCTRLQYFPRVLKTRQLINCSTVNNDRILLFLKILNFATYFTGQPSENFGPEDCCQIDFLFYLCADGHTFSAVSFDGRSIMFARWRNRAHTSLCISIVNS